MVDGSIPSGLGVVRQKVDKMAYAAKNRKVNRDHAVRIVGGRREDLYDVQVFSGARVADGPEATPRGVVPYNQRYCPQAPRFSTLRDNHHQVDAAVAVQFGNQLVRLLEVAQVSGRSR